MPGFGKNGSRVGLSAIEINPALWLSGQQLRRRTSEPNCASSRPPAVALSNATAMGVEPRIHRNENSVVPVFCSMNALSVANTTAVAA
jgi:hypothetical protein